MPILSLTRARVSLLPGWPRFLIRHDLTNPVALSPYAPVTLTDLGGTGSLDLVQSIGGDEIHAIYLGVPADPATMQWPTSRHDFARTGRFPLATGSACGNGVLEPGEQCDDGNRLNGDGCDANCTVPACGNGVLDAGEECDDGNLTDGDGCSATCQSEMIPGGGRATYDCAQEWLTNPVPPRDSNGIPVNVLTCTDDDPACDFGPATGDNTCTFHVAMCFNVTHRPGCTPLDVGQVRLLKPNEVRPANAVDSANRDALEGVLAGLWGPVAGQCSSSKTRGHDYYCQTVSDCPGGLGRCQGRLVPFVPPLVGPNSCTGFANIAVPLQQTQSGALSNGRRVLRLKRRPSRDPVGRKRRAETDSLTLICKVPS